MFMVKLRFGCTFMLIRCAQITMCEVTIGRCVARSALRSRLGLPDGRQHPRLTHTPPDREEPGMARAEAGNVCDSRATPSRPAGASCGKIPGAEHVTPGEPIRHRLDATRIPRARAWGFPTRSNTQGCPTRFPIVRSRGWHAQKPGIFATHERRPVGQPGIL